MRLVIAIYAVGMAIAIPFTIGYADGTAETLTREMIYARAR